ncbi:MAG: response regulator transcription factor [Deltaproteobacteria bacterium]|nr:response regulator transcription factor [Deltaproteobacteria bacterium]
MTERRSVLVVEDDPPIAASLVRGLRAEGFEVELCVRGDLAQELPVRTSFDAIVLDWNLPGLTGDALLQHWRHRVSAPVIVLTARVTLEDRLRAFELGAADYVAKPFFLDELLARIHARLGRRADEREAKSVSFANVSVELDGRRTLVSGEDIHLTPHEQNVLSVLVERPGRALTRRQLAEVALSAGEIDERTVDSHVARLRRKLGPEGAAHLQTVWGIGYRFALTLGKP